MGKHDADGAFYRPKHGGAKVHAVQRRRGVDWLPTPRGDFTGFDWKDGELYLYRHFDCPGIVVHMDDYVITQPDGAVQVITQTDFEAGFEFEAATESVSPELSAELQSKVQHGNEISAPVVGSADDNDVDKEKTAKELADKLAAKTKSKTKTKTKRKRKAKAKAKAS